jgi:hypothetical protein
MRAYIMFFLGCVACAGKSVGSADASPADADALDSGLTAPEPGCALKAGVCSSGCQKRSITRVVCGSSCSSVDKTVPYCFSSGIDDGYRGCYFELSSGDTFVESASVAGFPLGSSFRTCTDAEAKAAFAVKDGAR